jgi:two-component system, cell cycle sensor histidine kinase and response regulator CckA
MPRVLVVEDEGLIAHDISNRLEALGHVVIGTVGTAEDAVRRAGEADLVLMDIRLDGPADGVEAATQIRDRYQVPVVFLTAHADRSTLERAKRADPFGYIVKPLAPAALNTSIEIALHKHRAERRIREREAQLRAALDSIPEAVAVTGVHGCVSILNGAAEAMTGWSNREAEGQSLSKIVRLILRDSDRDAADLVSNAVLRDALVEIENGATLLSRGGRETAVEGAAAPMKSGGAVLTLRDVSEKRWEERQLRQEEKLESTSRLAARVSEDYGTLLATIRNQAEQLLRQFGEYAPARKPVEEIQQAATAGERITRRLAAFSTRQVSHRRTVSLNGILRDALKAIESLSGPVIELTVRTQPGAGKIRADAEQIEQAILSLVMHSRGAMPEGGRLLIETAGATAPNRGPFVLLAMTHTGREPEIEKLFEPGSTTDQGLALPMVHAIVSEHEGYVSAQPTAGGGCRFEILLPQWIDPAFPEHAPLSILLIESRESTRAQLHNHFEANSLNLLEAADAKEGLALAEAHDGALHALIAETAVADVVEEEMRRIHPGIVVLRIVDHAPGSSGEIQRPFTQQSLLERTLDLLKAGRSISSECTERQ